MAMQLAFTKHLSTPPTEFICEMPISEKLLATICSLSPNNFDLFVFAGLHSMRTSRIVSCNTLISPLRPWKVALDAD
jgi:hypothetical protein